MTIKVYADRIEIGAKTITTTPTGIRIGDSLAANTQQQGYISQANFTARELALGAFGFQGSVSGYTSGGSVSPFSNTIDKFPFAADTNASDVGDLSGVKSNFASHSSSVSGYTSGGYTPPNTRLNVIDKFPFAVNSNATDVGDLSAGRSSQCGQSSSTHGYSSGGFGPNSPPQAYQNTIDKFPFATNSNATDIGDLLAGTGETLGANPNSSISGYVAGGSRGPLGGAAIEKFPFATDSNGTFVGSLTVSRFSTTGTSSSTFGYMHGGDNLGSPPPPVVSNVIDKFPFAADTNATDVGDLLAATRGMASQSATSFGYSSGGSTPPPVIVNTIQKYSFSTDSNATDVGDLTQTVHFSAGQQF